MSATTARLTLLVVATVVFQTTVVPDLVLFGVVPDLTLALAIAAGLTLRPDQAAPVAFAAGLGFDVHVLTPLGLAALSHGITAAVTGIATRHALEGPRILELLAAAAATVFGVLLFVLLGAAIGQGHLLDSRLVRIISVLVLVNTAAVPMMQWACSWAVKGETGMPARLVRS